MRTTSPHLHRTTSAPSRSAPGFTIMEVALASFVLALGIATSIIAMQSGFRFLDVARDTTLSSQILQSEIERIRLLSWSGVTAMAAEEKVDLSTMFTTDPNLAARFTVIRTVARDDTRPADVRIITLRVSWNSYDGRTHTRRFETKYVKQGLYDYYYTNARR